MVSYVDIERYLGKCYEIALYPNWFEKGCFGSTAYYEKLESGHIKVTSQCRMLGPDGELNEAIGIATIADGNTNAKLKVQLFWPLKGDYWVIYLDNELVLDEFGNNRRAQDKPSTRLLRGTS